MLRLAQISFPNALKMPLRGNSIASSVLPSCPPTLLPPGAVKDRFSKFLVDIIVGIAQPRAKLAATASLHWVLADVGLEVLGADPARV